MIVKIELTKPEIEQILREHVLHNLLPPGHEIEKVESYYTGRVEIDIRPIPQQVVNEEAAA